MALPPGLSPRSPLALATVGSFVEVTAGYWDVYSHRLQPMDPWWNPAHLAIYIGILLILLGTLAWWPSRTTEPLLRPAMGAVTLGAFMQVSAGAFNEAWHHLGGPAMSLEPPHVLLVLGMITGVFGAVTGLATLRGVRTAAHQPRSLPLDALLLLAFLTTWLVTAGSSIYTTYVLPPGSAQGAQLMVVAAVAPLVLIPCARTLRTPGSLTLLGAGYAGINWALLVGYLGTPAYIPWTIPAVAAVEVLYLFLIRYLPPLATASAVGLASGILFYWIFFPFTYDLVQRSVLQTVSLNLILAGLVGGAMAHGVLRATLLWVTRGRAVGVIPGPEAPRA